MGRWDDVAPTADAFAAAVVSSMADPVLVLGPDIRLVWANEAAERQFGWTLEEMRDELLDGLVHPDDHETALHSMISVASKDVGSLIEIRARDRRGEYSWFEMRGRPWLEGPEPGMVIINMRPTTERRRWELAAGDSRLLAVVLDAAPVALMVLNAEQQIRGMNRALTRTLHRPIEEMLHRPIIELVQAEDQQAVTDALAQVVGTNGTVSVEVCLAAAQGPVPTNLTIVDLLADRAVRGFVVAASDISSLVEARTALHHMANHDDLTGLPNRTNLRGRLEGLINHRPRSACTLLFGDVDGLKPINDTHGHRAGDAALTEIAARLRKVTREDDYVARLSGDEFVMLISTTDDDVIADICERIEAEMREPIPLPDGPAVTMSISTGVAPMSDSDLNPDDILAAADAAMYRMKRQRTGG